MIWAVYILGFTKYIIRAKYQVDWIIVTTCLNQLCIQKIDGYTFLYILSITIHFFLYTKLIRICNCHYPIHLTLCMEKLFAESYNVNDLNHQNEFKRGPNEINCRVELKFEPKRSDSQYHYAYFFQNHKKKINLSYQNFYLCNITQP